jgi:uncharacterized membrane protein YqjE
MSHRFQDGGAGAGGGPLDRLLGSLGNMLATLIGIGRTRLELLTVELQEEFQRVAMLLLWGFVALLAGGLGLLFAGLTLIFAFWDTHRTLAAVLVTAGFALVALVAGLLLRRQIVGHPRFLGATLRELEADAEALQSARYGAAPDPSDRPPP